MATGDVYQVTIIGNLNGQVVNNVLHGQEVSAHVGTRGAEYCARGFFADVSADYLNGICAAYSIAGIYCRRIHPTPGIPYLHVPAAGHVGLVAGEAASTTAAGVITLYSSVMSKSGRGRIYMPGVPEAEQANGVASSTLIGDYSDFADAITANWLGTDGTTPDGSSWTGCIWSRKLATANPIIQHTVQPNLGTIRGRRAPRLSI